MSLVEQNRIDLDAPVSRYLTRWQLPNSEFDNDGVRIRRLLSHTAGLTDGLGFGDYAGQETLPATEEALSSPRASNGAKTQIIVGQEPGSEFNVDRAQLRGKVADHVVGYFAQHLSP